MRVILFPILFLLTGCAADVSTTRSDVATAETEYVRMEAFLMQSNLVGILAEVSGQATEERLHQYVACGLARYADENGFRHARHLRTNVVNEAGLWRGDAVYTVSASRPNGLAVIDTDVTLADCRANGIPTV